MSNLKQVAAPVAIAQKRAAIRQDLRRQHLKELIEKEALAFWKSLITPIPHCIPNKEPK